MAVSKTRLTVRVVLVVLLLGVIGLAFFAWKNNQPDALWERAQAAIKNDDPQTAKLHLQNLLKKEPDHAEAHVAMANLLRDEAKKNNPQAAIADVPAAIEHLAKAAELRPNDPAILRPLLIAYEQSGRTKDASKIASLLQKADRNDPDALYRLSLDALVDKDFAKARPLLERLRSVKGEPRIRTLALLAAYYEGTSQPKEREAILVQSLAVAARPPARVSPQDKNALDGLLVAAIKNAPTAAEADRRMGIALSLQEVWSAKAKRPVGAARATSSLVDAYFAAHPLKSSQPNRAKAVKSILDRSIALTEAALKSGRAIPQLQWILVRQTSLSGDSAKAAARAQAALESLKKQTPRNEEVELDLHLVAAEAFSQHGKFKSALKHAEALIKRGKSEVHLSSGHLLAGNIHAFEGRHETALFHFQEARKKGLGQSLRVHFGLANSFVALGRWQEARPHLEALNIKPADVTGPDRSWAKTTLGDGASIRLRLAQAYLATGDSPRADAILDAFQGTPHEPAALSLKVVHAWQSDRALARKRMDAARAKFLNNMALAYLDIRLNLAENKPQQAEKIAATLARARPMDLTAQILQYSIVIRRGDRTAALKLLDDLIKRFPDKPVLLLARARTLLDLKDYKAATQAAKQLARLPDWKTAAEYIGALAALRSQNLKDAADRLEALQGGQRQFGDIDLLKGNLSLSQGNPEDAIRELTTALQYTRLQAVAGRSLLRSLLVLAYEKSPQEALQKVDGLLKQHPTQISLLLAKAELQSRTGDYSGALVTLRTLDSTHPDSADGPFYLARFWLGMGQIPDAAREIARAVRNSPQNLSVRSLAASIALQRNRPDDALAQIEAGLKLSPKNAAFLLLKSAVLIRQKKLAEAADLVEQVTKDSPQQIQAWLLLAGIHAAENRTDRALAVLADGRKKNPTDFALIRETVRHLVTGKKLDEADKLAASLAGDKPEFPILSRLTVAFDAAGEFGRARKWAEKSLAAAKMPNQVTAAELELANLALAESNKPKADPKWLQEARSRFAAIVKRDPKNVIAANNLAWILAVRLNDPMQARKVVDPIAQGTRMDRLPPDAIDTIMVVYRAQRDFRSLEKLLREAMRVQPGNPKWIRAYVALAIERNRLNAAIVELDQLHRLRGWWAEPSFGLARIYSAMARHNDALSVLQRALSISPSHIEARLMAVRIAAAVGDSKLVLLHADEALKLAPDLWSVHLRKANALKAVKRTDEATAFLDSGISRLRARIKTSPTPAAYAALALLVQAKDGPDAALDVLQEGLKARPGNFALVRRALGLLLAAGKSKDAAALLDKHVAKDAPAVQLIVIAQSYHEAKQHDAALTWSNKAQSRAGEDLKSTAGLLTANIQLARGLKAKDRKLLEQARSGFEAVLKREPKQLVAGNNLAWLLASELNQPAEALKVAERIRGDAPVERLNRSFVDTLSLVYRRAKEWKKARDLLQQATATFATHAPFYLQLGEVYVATKDYRAAQLALQRAIDLGLSKADEAAARKLLLDIGQQAGAGVK